MERPGGEAGHAALQHERGHAAVLPRAIDRREDQEVVGQVGQADPDLGAGEDVGVALPAGGRPQVGRVGPSARLRQRERAELCPLRLRDEPAPALRVRPPLEQRQRVQPDMDAHHHPERRVGALQLLAQDRQRDVVHARPAPRLRDRRPQVAQLAHPGEHLRVRLPGLVPGSDPGQDLRGNELADGLANKPVLVGEGQVDHRCAPRQSVGVVADATPKRASDPR